LIHFYKRQNDLIREVLDGKIITVFLYL